MNRRVTTGVVAGVLSLGVLSGAVAAEAQTYPPSEVREATSEVKKKRSGKLDIARKHFPGEVHIAYDGGPKTPEKMVKKSGGTIISTMPDTTKGRRSTFSVDSKTVRGWAGAVMTEGKDDGGKTARLDVVYNLPDERRLVSFRNFSSSETNEKRKKFERESGLSRLTYWMVMDSTPIESGDESGYFQYLRMNEGNIVLHKYATFSKAEEAYEKGELDKFLDKPKEGRIVPTQEMYRAMHKGYEKGMFNEGKMPK